MRNRALAAVLLVFAASGAGCYNPPETVDLGYELNIPAATVADGDCADEPAKESYCHHIRAEIINEQQDRKTATPPERWEAAYNTAGGEGPTPWFSPVRAEGPTEVQPGGSATVDLYFEVQDDEPLEILRYTADWSDGPGVFFIPAYS